MIRWFIHRPVATAMLYVAVSVLGLAAWRNMPIELLPDTELPRLSVAASWPGASPEIMEAFVTAKLEAAVQQVRSVSKVTSTSQDRFGSAEATLEVRFARNTDMDFARLDLSERLAALEPDLPPGVSPPRVSPYVPEAFRQQSRPFLSYTFTGPHTVEALRAWLDESIAPAIAEVEGVAEVEATGGRARELEIELDPDRINALRLDPTTVRQRIEELEYVREAGRVWDGRLLRTVAIRHHARSTDDVRNVVLMSGRGGLVRLEDIATVRDTYEEPTRYYRIDGRPAVSFQVHREPRTNAVRVADRVKATIAALPLPPGTRLILDDDQSAAIRAQLSNLRYRAVVSAAVIFLVLFAFLRSFPGAIVVFATIGFSILIALNLMYVAGFTLNVLTLMGLAMGFGLTVDNAIVVLENIYRRRPAAGKAEEAGKADTAVAEAAETGAREVVLPVLAATLTTLVALIPFVYLQGELQIYYLPLAIVVGLTLLASVIVAFTFIPALAAQLLTPAPAIATPTRSARSAFAALPALSSRTYSRLLHFTLRHPWLTVAAAAALLAASYRVFDRNVARGVVWRSWWADRSYIDINIALPRGEELERTDELTRFFEEKLRELPEIARFVTRVEPQSARIQITFPDSLERTAVPVVIKEQMVAYSYLFAGADVRVYGFGPSFYGGGGGAPNYAIHILGYNFEKVRAIAEDLARRLRGFSRIRDVDINSQGWYTRDKVTEFVLALDRRRLGLHDLTAQDVVRQVAAAVRGRYGRDRVRVAGEELQYTVKLAGHDRLDLHGLAETLLLAPGGEGVRLGNVATVSQREVMSNIVREDQQYRRIVAYEFRGPPRLGDRVRDAVIASTALPTGYTIQPRQDWGWARAERQQVYGVLAVSLALVFMVTAALFESLRQPLCILLAVPMALIGVFAIFSAAEASFTREAYIGVIMMGGIVVNNAILLVDHVNRLRRAEGKPLHDALVRATLDRVRPILMTSSTTVFGLLPLVLFAQDADANIWNALAYALIGGLASSTVLVLTVTPAVYWLFERGPERRRLVGTGADPAAVPASLRPRSLQSAAVRARTLAGALPAMLRTALRAIRPPRG
jgi:HAE1 family hydrophobic/amphiphilic exporter-1